MKSPFHRRGWLVVSLIAGLGVVILLVGATIRAEARSQSVILREVTTKSHQPDTAPALARHLQVEIERPLQPTVRLSERNDLSPPLGTLDPTAPARHKGVELPRQPLPYAELKASPSPQPQGLDPVLQAQHGSFAMPSPLESFEGLANVARVLPPDPNGDVGPDHYVQMVNVQFAIWNKSGDLLYGPADIGTLWRGFGGPCETSDDGDPIVLYDPLADRWLMSQMAWPNLPMGPFYECIAISQTPDPTGAWHRYQFLYSNQKLNDYPKLGVWTDGYYMTANQYQAFSQDWAGQGVAVFERDQMLLGQPARMVSFDLLAQDPRLGGMLPADLDGLLPPPDGAPGLLLAVNDDAWGYPSDQLQLWEFAVDWEDPESSVLSGPGLLPTAPFRSMCLSTRDCIPQPDVSPPSYLDAIAERLMHRVQYRNLGDRQVLLANHTVDADGSSHAGIRWYELGDSGSGWSLVQQGTYAPDSDHRWMASIAMDAVGNIALGYSVSGPDTYPSIRYAGRLAGDPLNTLPQAEASLIEGGGSQTHGSSRWGDYSMMAVDPLDDCTFWYTQEYYTATSEMDWHTRIGAFRFPSCTTGPTGTVEGQVTDSATGAPIEGAVVSVGSLSTITAADGRFSINRIPVGVYSATVSAYRYAPRSLAAVTISDGATTSLSVVLEPLPLVTVSGQVIDGSGQGWPLYARVHVSDYLPGPVYTDPATGRYSVDLVQGATHTLQVEALVNGYQEQRRTLSGIQQDATEDFSLQVDAAACSAPGYSRPYVFWQDFESSNGGFRVVNVRNSSWAWGVPTAGPGSAHSGQRVWATGLNGTYNDGEHSYLLTPPIDLSEHAGADTSFLLSWWQWLDTELGYDTLLVEVSIDGGVSWRTVYGPASGSVDTQWTEHTVTLGPEVAVPGFLVSFSFRSDTSAVRAGAFIDDVSITVLETQTEHSADFEGSNDGYRHVNVANGTWAWGTPASGPGRAHSGVGSWATNLSGNYNDSEHSYLVSPDLDLSSSQDQHLLLSWWQWLQTESCCDGARVEISRDAGRGWTTVYEARGIVDRAWTRRHAILDPSYATSAVRLSFGLRTDGSVTYPGMYVDDVTLSTFRYQCLPQTGAMAIGHVYDDNSGLALNGATVASDAGRATRTVATTADPGLDDGFYVLFAPQDSLFLKALMPGGYGAVSYPISPASGEVISRNFRLPAGRLVADSSQLAVELDLGGSASGSWSLVNQGALPADFVLSEADLGMEPVSRSSAAGGLSAEQLATENRSSAFAMRLMARGLPYPRQSVLSSAIYEYPPDDLLAESVQTIGAPQAWGSAAPLPAPVYRAAAATCGQGNLAAGSTYVFGGARYGAPVLGEAWRYSPDTDAWTRLADMPVPLMNMEAVCLASEAGAGDLIYLVGGYNGSAQTNHLQIYDTAGDTWMATTWPVSGSPMLATWRNQIYAFGGTPGPSRATWKYDPSSGQWTDDLAPMPVASIYGSAVTVGDAIYVIGGYGDQGLTPVVQRYDPAADAWNIQGPALPDGRMSPAAAWYGDQLLVISGGGRSGDLWSPYQTSLVYDVGAWPEGAWSLLPEAIPTPVVAPAYACAELPPTGMGPPANLPSETPPEDDAGAGRIYLAGGVGASQNLSVHQFWDGGLTCHGQAADAPWLAAQPMTGTIAAGASQPIQINFQASPPAILQPGIYRAALRVFEDTPYALEPLQITMRVGAPPSYGKLAGTVTSLGHCDSNPAPLKRADVRIQGSTGITWTTTTDADGIYQIWLDAIHSPLTVTFSAPDHQSGQASGIMVAGQETTVQDLALRRLEPCLQVAPAAIEAFVAQDRVLTVPMTLTNSGALSMTFQLIERVGPDNTPSSLPPAASLDGQVVAGLERADVQACKRAGVGPSAVRGTCERAGSVAPMPGNGPRSTGGPDPFGYVFRDSRDADGPRFEWVEIAPPAGGSGTEIAALTGTDDTYFWSLDLPFPFNFYGTDYSRLAVASNGTLYFQDDYLGLANVPIPGYSDYPVQRFIAHLWDDLVVAPGAIYYLAEPDRIIIEYYQMTSYYAPGLATWQVILYPNHSILFQYKDMNFGAPASNGSSATVGIQGDPLVGLQYSYNQPALSANQAICFAYPGEPQDCSLFTDVPWLSTEPISGTVPSDALVRAAINLDARGLESGVYRAALVVRSNDPLSPTVRIPVSMTTDLLRPAISEVRLTNIRETSLTVSWLTDQPSRGLVRYGANPESLGRVALSGNGSQVNDAHHVVLENLQPGVTYYFQVESEGTADDNDGALYSATTAPATGGLPASHTIYGQVMDAEGGPASNVLVIITLEDADEQGSPGQAALLSAITNEAGYWSANLGNARTANLAGFFAYSMPGDNLRLEARTGARGTTCPSALDTAGAAPAPGMMLGQAPCPGLRPLSLQPAWNLISLPVQPARAYTASSACNEIASQGGSIVEIDRWRDGGWEGYLCALAEGGGSGSDFALDLGQAYFLNSRSDSVWGIAGTPVQAALPLALGPGWNAIGLPHTDTYTASSLCAEISGQGVPALEVDRWQAGGWEGYLCGVPLADFPIAIGRGYMLKVDAGGNIAPAGSEERPADRGLPAWPLAESQGIVAIHELQVSNVRDTALAIHWLTDEPVPGYVRYAEAGDAPSDATVARVGLDERGRDVVATSHYVVLRDLRPGTEYLFDIVSGGTIEDNGGSYYQVQTNVTLPLLSTPHTIYGQVIRLSAGDQARGTVSLMGSVPGTSVPAAGAIVTLQILDADGTGTAGETALLSALTDEHGIWYANLGNARTPDGAAFLYSAAGDQVRILARGAAGPNRSATSSQRQVDTSRLRPAPTLFLGSTAQRLHLPVILAE